MDHVTGIASVPSGDSSSEGAGAPALADLFRRAARGDESAFSALYDATAARVHGLVLRVVRDPAQAEEVTQETYLEVWRTSARFDADRGSALSWLMTIAHRRAVDRVRSAEAAHRRDNNYHDQSETVPHDSTAEAAATALEATRVRRAMQSLTEIQREALELAFFGGYTHTEVASMLDVPIGTAKTRIRDGLIRLRDALGVNQ
ncbi:MULTISPECIES: ECF RNA polymerase sigma factor SigK [unclassified Nocardioides]|uniref:ECF RNA polymerase sigma factor SigK n=1 Tax=unclassified Nocardioides TaxID=2615069 RepID=UPI0006FE331C|nr:MULTISPECIES: ECF RNA polymerase sigma factor SigK [unclassified Nocardioides]KQY62619.1 RNA polymerase subunit sigma [Nocardioides sp. Root140]KQZ75981.1 RNA polymerase subunit sigma [Nocardioides sp. Root151]KRF15054.1 RNA polymerase subunit sigma [Nocardioides sp. Soil796]